MAVKEDVLECLENNRGEYLSGEQLAKSLCVSRNAVWKAVQILQKEGYRIEAITNKGYSLPQDSDIISRQGIMKYLTSDTPFDIEVQKIVTSTNNVTKERTVAGAAEWTVCVAEQQSGGKGRYGRDFYSPDSTGIYMSILLRPKQQDGRAPLLTVMAAVAVSEAIEAVSEKKASIKWVNDIFCGGKKVCGILTEAAVDLESGGMDYAILGIGINVYTPKGGFPAEISATAGAVFSEAEESCDVRNKMVAKVLENFARYYVREKAQLIAEYKRRSFLIGEKVEVLKGETREKVLVSDIDEECRLKVVYEDSREELLYSGEVRVIV